MTLPAGPPVRPPRSRAGCLFVGAATSAGLFVAAVVVIATTRLDRPTPVPEGFRAPDSLPVAASRLDDRDLVLDSDRTGNFELYRQPRGPDGRTSGPLVALTGDGRYDSWWPRLSPDRRTVLFYRTPAGTHDRDFSVTSLWAAGADGSGPVQLRPAGTDGWTFQGHAEWSPDGTQLVMFGGSRFSPQIHLTDRLGRSPRQLSDRPGTNLDPSFSPDGRWIVFIGCPRPLCTEPDYEVYRMNVTGGDVTRLTDDSLRDHDPYYSPDGTRLAWLTQLSDGMPGVWDVRVADAGGRSPRRLVGDDGVTSKPDWSPDGRSILVHRIAPGATSFGIYAVNVDGTGLRPVVTGQASSYEYPDG